MKWLQVVLFQVFEHSLENVFEIDLQYSIYTEIKIFIGDHLFLYMEKPL